MIKKFVFNLLFILLCAVILALGLRGIPGNPTSEDLNYQYWKDDGPLELSPDRGKFALTYSIIENKSVEFSLPIARFATPDLGYANGKYVSLFAPGVSYIIAPGYILGKSVGLAQIGTFSVIALFAVFNVLLLRNIGIRLGANPPASTIAAMTFLFATPAFSYAVTLYQHHISTFLILSSIYLLVRFNNFWSLSLIWFLMAASIPVDYPNLFLMFPIGLVALGKIIAPKISNNKMGISIKPLWLLTFFAAALPLAFFLWFNKLSYGNPLQLSGTVSSVKAIDERGNPTAPEQSGTENIQKLTNPEEQSKSAVGFFRTRNLLSGFHIHFLSPDRGIMLYTPIVLFGIAGILFLYKTNPQITALLLAVIGANVLLYSMWGDPYGGWAFGSRYLIPTYAVMSIFLAIALHKWKTNALALSIFFIVLAYSVAVNTLGALTTNRIPPKVEAIPLSNLSGREEKYTYERNIDYLNDNRSKSFVFQTFAIYYMNARQYFSILFLLITSVTGFLLFRLTIKGKLKND